jgi:hypothetical protein
VALAQAGPVQTVTDVPFNEVTPDPCTQDVVTYTGGAFHTVITTVVDANNGVHIIMSVNDQNITGVGSPSGNQYRLVGAATSSFNFRVIGYPAEMTTTIKFNVISPSSTNENVLAVFHVTVNANATTSADVSEFRINCNSD